MAIVRLSVKLNKYQFDKMTAEANHYVTTFDDVERF